MPTRVKARLIRQKTRQLDAILQTVEVPQRPRNGWLAAVREALRMNKTQVAKRLGITSQSQAELEAAELKGSITLNRLQRAATALGCELAYTLVPKKPLETMVSEQALRRAKQKLVRINRSQALEAATVDERGLSAAVHDLARELELERPTDLWNE